MVHDPSAALAEWGKPAATATVAVLAVHGRGLSPEWMREASARFAAAPTRFFAPAAAGGTWYPHPFQRPREENEPALTSALAVVDAAHERIARVGFPPARIVVWGFSQGACLLSDWLLSREPTAGSALLFTGGFLAAEPPAASVAGTPARRVVMRSISEDPFVPADRVRQTAAELRRRGSDVDVRIDPGIEHIISDEAFATGSALIAEAGSI